ncbi:uncharacterized protein LOC124172733 [Ischnura elegans]|uniref:uncharacterized protein LOC124172733 n=1 Tax=Ischnura elegans TaxID=197161 RepID=UPI001ED880DA|nr:uncharacterized protein LOC124172733 [Ischnura elegans]
MYHCHLKDPLRFSLVTDSNSAVYQLLSLGSLFTVMGDCDIRGMCRLCLCKCDNLVEIFVLGEGHGYYAAEVIQDLLQIEVSLVDGFPQCICAECLDKLTDFKVFKDKCLKSRSTFQQMLQRKIEQAEQKDLQDVQVDVLPMVCSIKEEPQESEIVEIPVEPEVSINEEPNEMNSFAVVLFLGNEDTLAVVPEKWLIRRVDSTESYWPNGPGTERKVRCQREPQQTWDVYPVRVLEEKCETYDRARLNCMKVESTSNLNSAGQMGRGCRIKKRKRTDMEGERERRGESDDEASTQHSLLPPPPPKCSSTSLPTRGLHQSEGGSSTNGFQHQPASENSRKPESSKDKEKIPQSPTASCSLGLQLKMERKINQVLQNQQEILIRLNEIADKSKEKIEENVFEHLPFQHLRLVTDFENELENSDIRNQFIHFLKRVGGSTPQDATRRGLRSIFSDDIAKNYSLEGLKGNIKFGDTRIYSSLSCAVLRNFPAATKKEVDSAIRDWLRHANDRRKYKKNVTGGV